MAELGVPMIGRVKIQCVNTDKVVDTGYGMDRAFFDDAPLDRNSLVCPAVFAARSLEILIINASRLSLVGAIKDRKDGRCARGSASRRR
jgi:hypothetical protein